MNIPYGPASFNHLMPQVPNMAGPPAQGNAGGLAALLAYLYAGAGRGAPMGIGAPTAGPAFYNPQAGSPLAFRPGGHGGFMADRRRQQMGPQGRAGGMGGMIPAGQRRAADMYYPGRPQPMGRRPY